MDKNIILSSGKTIYANRGLISIIKNGKDWELGEGYDCDIFLTEYAENEDHYQPAFTKDELIELAEILISRWQAFRFDVINGDVPTKSND